MPAFWSVSNNQTINFLDAGVAVSLRSDDHDAHKVRMTVEMLGSKYTVTFDSNGYPLGPPVAEDQPMPPVDPEPDIPPEGV